MDIEYNYTYLLVPTIIERNNNMDETYVIPSGWGYNHLHWLVPVRESNMVLTHLNLKVMNVKLQFFFYS